MKINFLPVLVIGLITASVPAHAESSLFDSWSKKVTDISHKVKEQVEGKIHDYYGDNSPTLPATNKSPEVTPPKAPVLTPEITPIAALRASLSQCQKFLGLMYNPSYETDPKKAAAIYLNAALDFAEADFNHKPNNDEIAERNKCV